jgi:hypothetical protein
MVAFEGLYLAVGQGNQMMAFNVGEIKVDPEFIQTLLDKFLEKFSPDAPVSMSFRKAHFETGYDLKEFAQKMELELQQGEIEQ